MKSHRVLGPKGEHICHRGEITGCHGQPGLRSKASQPQAEFEAKMDISHSDHIGLHPFQRSDELF